jgi:ABC-type uncharacterized transport system auxiliary subunit
MEATMMVWVLMRKSDGEVEADGVFTTLEAAKHAAQNAVNDFEQAQGDEIDRELLKWRRHSNDVYTSEAFSGLAEFVINEATFEW